MKKIVLAMLCSAVLATGFIMTTPADATTNHANYAVKSKMSTSAPNREDIYLEGKPLSISDGMQNLQISVRSSINLCRNGDLAHLLNYDYSIVEDNLVITSGKSVVATIPSTHYIKTAPMLVDFDMVVHALGYKTVYYDNRVDIVK